MHKHITTIAYFLIFVLVLGACSGSIPEKPPEVDLNTLDLSSAKRTIDSLNVSASGIDVVSSDEIVIDYSNVSDGYVMVLSHKDPSSIIKAQVKGASETYTYSLSSEVWTAFPLSEGDGNYEVAVYDNISGTKYALLISADFPVTLKDEFAPFLKPNQYVDFASAPKAVALAAELTKDSAGVLDKVDAVYSYVIGTLTYDKELAMTVSTGYLPVLDRTLEKKCGICFDYASLMTGMLRSIGIPCKLVIGYAGDAYHAWINVYSEEEGWIDKVVYFDGTTWQRMDPTFASSSSANNEFIGDGSNYSPKFFY